MQNLNQTGWILDLNIGQKNGITAYCDILEKQTLKSFQTLKQKHNLGKQDQF